MCECCYCGKEIVWDNNFSFEDCGIEGDGIVKMYHCNYCGAQIECKVPLGEEDDDQRD